MAYSDSKGRLTSPLASTLSPPPLSPAKAYGERRSCTRKAKKLTDDEEDEDDFATMKV